MEALRPPAGPGDPDPAETGEWVEAFDQLVERVGTHRARFILGELVRRAGRRSISLDGTLWTSYVNTIPVDEEPPFPGDEKIERRIRAIVRWNAVVMVLRADHVVPNIGGHLATYASAATLFEVGFNHFFRARQDSAGGDQVFFQGHASPGIYARAFLEGRLAEGQLEHFRQETAGGGLSSYPHPWLMPDFWEFPTVSMGLSPLAAIYQARFNRYLRDRGIRDTTGSRVWAFIGDGECDEPEALGALSLAGREGLDNLIFVVNCNLQRLDGPVRGNGKIIQELEGVFRGSGWNVIKVVWGRDWDPLLKADESGLLVRRMEEAVDGDYQMYSVAPGSYTREHFFGKHPKLLKLVEHLSDDEIRALRRGGHDVRKIYAAYDRATRESAGRPTVVLAKTVKGWTLGEGAEGRNVAHQLKKFNQDQLRKLRDRLQLPIPDAQLAEPTYYRPPEDGEEMTYLLERRRALGGFLPRREARPRTVSPASPERLSEFHGGTSEEISTTKAYARVLAALMKEKELGRRIVPIIPDEARTFGLDSLFRRHGIYSPEGQRYPPVDKDMLMTYREAKDGQLLEEGITEAGAMGSFIAAGTSYATHGEPMFPFYIFYAMFGYQRTGDLIWAAADARARGFLLGATAGRTTLSGEGLQHQDGHSHLLFSAVPTVRAYDPAWAYEVAVIVEAGLRHLIESPEPCCYYVTLYNEPYPQPPMPEGSREGILKGLYLYRAAPQRSGNGRSAQILGSGPLLREALRAQALLAERYGVAADVWSATSYLALRRDALSAERENLLHPGGEPRIPYLFSQLGGTTGPIVAVSDYLRAVPDQIAPWLPGRWSSLGTDGFGRSDSRSALRRHFEINAEFIAYSVLRQLSRQEKFPSTELPQAMKELGIDPNRRDPASS